MMHITRSLSLSSWILLGAVSLSAQSFEANFESYTSGDTVTWGEGSGAKVVDEGAVPQLGSPNRSASMKEPSLRMMSDVRSISAGKVSTMAMDFVDLSEGYSKVGLALGFGNGPDLTSVTAAGNIVLHDGEIIHDRVGAASRLTNLGATRYEKGQVYRLFIVMNDTDKALLRYEGMEDLAPKSYEVWVGPRGGAIKPVLEATIARTPRFAGFRSWSDTSSAIYVDNVKISGGVGLRDTYFQDNFESYSKGGAASWKSGKGGVVVDHDTLEDFGKPNKAIRLSGDRIRLFEELGSKANGTVSTFSASFVEKSAQGGRIRIGFSNGLEGPATAAVELANGQIHNGTAGSTTEQGLAGYRLGVANHIFIIANDSGSALTDYYGEEDLQPGRFEVWVLSGDGTLVRTFEANLAGGLDHLALIADGGDSGFYVDNVRVTGGVRLVSGKSLCLVEPETPGAATGVPFTVAYTVAANLPAGSTYEVSADGDVSFPDGSTGAAGTAGTFTAVVNNGHRANITFKVTIKNAAGTVLCRGSERVMAFDYRPAPELRHPSVINTQEQLDAMRNHVRHETSSVARSGWDAMLETPFASLGYPHTAYHTVEVIPAHTGPSEDDFREDGTAARSHALQWVVTGDPAHRDKALAILNSWGRKFRKIESSNPAQVHLEAAWALPVWISAADILRYHDNGAANWHPTDMAAFNNFMEVLYQEAASALDERNNWAVSAALAVMSYGAWSDDPEIFQVGLDYQLLKLNELSQSSGEIVETCRDTWHSQYSIVSWGDSAELAYNLGYDDLYEARFEGQSTPRLAVILEYFAKLMLGRAEPPCGNDWRYDYEGEYRRFDNYEVPYNHYIYREGVSYLPNFKEMVEDHWRENVGEDAHFFLWSRLTHGAQSVDPGYQTSTGKGILLPFTVVDERWLDTGSWMGWVNDAFYPWVYVNNGGWVFINDTPAAGPAGKKGTWIFLTNDGAKVPGEGGGPGTWAGAQVDQQGNLDTGGLAGWIVVDLGTPDWVFSWNYFRWMYLPESNIINSGAWAFLPN